jgi:hypothetical protein
MYSPKYSKQNRNAIRFPTLQSSAIAASVRDGTVSLSVPISLCVAISKLPLDPMKLNVKALPDYTNRIESRQNVSPETLAVKHSDWPVVVPFEFCGS